MNFSYFKALVIFAFALFVAIGISMSEIDNMRDGVHEAYRGERSGFNM